MSDMVNEYLDDATTGKRPPRPYPFSEAVALDLDPLYEKLRAEEPVTRVSCPYGEDAWLVTTHADMKTILGDPRFSRALAAEHDESRLTPLPINTSILGMDSPDHPGCAACSPRRSPCAGSSCCARGSSRRRTG